MNSLQMLQLIIILQTSNQPIQTFSTHPGIDYVALNNYY